MKQYLDLVANVLTNGHVRGDRTGTGTRSIFGTQSRYDLTKGFPLCTTKKVNFKPIVEELLWFLRGETNINTLDAKIWNEWAREDGELGPIYGFNWRNWGGRPSAIIQPNANPGESNLKTYLGVADGKSKGSHVLGKTWEGMIARCYDKNSIGYRLYGAKGVHVCDRWLEFRHFAVDSVELPGWSRERWLAGNLTLDKDEYGDGFKYSPSSCRWVTPSENSMFKSRNTYTVKRTSDGEEFTFRNASQFCKEQEIDDRNFSDLWTGTKNAKTRCGFSLVSVDSVDTGVDQIKQAIDLIQNNPESRRIIISSWNPTVVPYMALPPCHITAQFYVRDGHYLDCHMYQRSADLALGVPFNIASYALLTTIIARETGLEPGEFVHTIGDCHIYLNHVEGMEEQLKRHPQELPALSIKNSTKDFDELKFEDFTLDNYFPHEPIKFAISV